MEVPLNEDSELPASANSVHQQLDNVLPDTINGGYISTSFLLFPVILFLVHDVSL